MEFKQALKQRAEEVENLLKQYIENSSKYAESIYYNGYYEIKNKKHTLRYIFIRRP